MQQHWMITGAGGQLGRRLVELLPAATALTSADLDITHAGEVKAAVAEHDLVINAAAWTDVDGAETREADATLVNGAEALSAACAATGTRLIHLSTDYVFAGDATTPYAEDAPTAPINAYGRSKLAGEQAVLAIGGAVVRTAWLYDTNGRNFLTTMLRLAASQETVSVVDDQHGQPTWALALARQLVALGSAAAPAGIYHGTSKGMISWYQFTRAIFEEAGLDPARVLPTTSDKFPRPAKRPSYSVLSHARWAQADLQPMPDWRDMLTEAMTAR